MKRKLTTLWMICIAMFIAGSGTMWGQQYVLQNSVNNEFGAGESSYITPGIHGQQTVESPWNVSGFNYTSDGTTSLISFGGGYSNSLGTTPPDIQLGGVKNTVIRTYTGNGFSMGWISVLNRVAAYNNANSGCGATGGNCTAASYPNPVYEQNTIAGSYLTPTTVMLSIN